MFICIKAKLIYMHELKSIPGTTQQSQWWAHLSTRCQKVLNLRQLIVYSIFIGMIECHDVLAAFH